MLRGFERNVAHVVFECLTSGEQCDFVAPVVSRFLSHFLSFAVMIMITLRSDEASCVHTSSKVSQIGNVDVGVNVNVESHPVGCNPLQILDFSLVLNQILPLLFYFYWPKV